MICGSPRPLQWAAAGLLAATLHWQAVAAGLEARIESSSHQPIEDVAVILEPINARVSPHGRKATIAQQDREFKPYLTIVQTGTAIDFPNRDAIKHHTYSFSATKTFEIKLYAGQPAKPVVFDKAGDVALGCNIHDWMEAYVLVVDTPYFAKTDASGRVLLERVPPGRYRLRLWHPRQKTGFPSREIALGQQAARLVLSLDVAPRVVKPKPPPDSEKY